MNKTNAVNKEVLSEVSKVITVADAVKQLVKLKSKSEQLNALEKLYTDIVKSAMGDQEKLEIAGHIVSYFRYKDKRLDWAALKLAEPDVYSKYLRENERRRFSVK